MSASRSAAGVTMFDGRIFVSGGHDGLQIFNTVRVPFRWCDRAAGGGARRLLRLTRFRNVAVVSDVAPLLVLQVEHYNHHTNRWHPAPPMMNKRCRHGAAALGSHMYVAGGYDGSGFLSGAEVFSSASGQWSLLVAMNTRRSRVSLVATSGRLYAVGGYEGQNKLSSVEMFNSDTNRWTLRAPMICHEGGVGVGCIPLQPA